MINNTNTITELNDTANKHYNNVAGLKMCLASIQVEYLIGKKYNIDLLIEDRFVYDSTINGTLEEQIVDFYESKICAENNY